ncbi:potassium-transporting ATPase subunit KdpA [Alkalilimnicola ehrlichii]|uniref:Potassium-transporting ATPase potassium-binding subunit n=1 Tax=Alkalilimnicola ehrlichii TaxID=351052 RepID=A0A3E0X017_9GAMM|nr:potassium-transporting ATPase subunit KdpA [Alkalilimnicola ehrlichii]RFA30168.1 potassium-transporting ATPase subunit KdpA [Alkalilimnicola ehrlichii]RFA37517.1 potassium-transporting ATPase subunit KdpA [Alkalilimnicola ehrlichii]
MSTSDFLQIALFIGVLLALTPFVGGYMARVYSGERTFLTPLMSPLERGIYRLCGVDPQAQQRWTGYAVAMLAFNACGFLLLFLILRLQGYLPFNPEGIPGMSADLAFNTAVSFTTNTNWQAYSGESGLSYLSQMMGLTTQNFVSAATGMAVLVALIRGLVRRDGTVGSFPVDLVRTLLYILLPLSLLAAIVLVAEGVPQNLSAYVPATTVEGAQQTIAQGPAASQIAIKQLGTNGGGFFGVNSAHPLENPTPISNFLEMVFILLIPMALVYTFGKMVKDRRQGLAIFAAMGVLYLAGLFTVYFAEQNVHPELAAAGIETSAGNMEGKETRFGVVNSVLWAQSTTAASNGSVNSMHDSFTPLGGMIPMFNMMLGEVVFGGVGAGLYGMLIFVVLTVFIAGLMVGRTPEYLGKKIEAKEVTLALIAIFTLPLGIVAFSAVGSVLPVAAASIQEVGPHGLSEILYAYSSATGNNGSAFAGFGADTPYHNTMLGIAMLVGRFFMILPVLAIAGSLAAKQPVAASAGTFPTHGPLFVTLLVAVVLIVGGLTFFPALALGPIAEHLAMIQGMQF